MGTIPQTTEDCCYATIHLLLTFSNAGLIAKCSLEFRSWAQVEIKLRLPSKEAHDRVAHELRSSFRETHNQENYFFDGKNGELSKQRMVLRCRFYNHDKRAIVTLKVTRGLRDAIYDEALDSAQSCATPC